jgi:hypothetical protein
MHLVPPVAFLTDTFHEVNGAARTCRELAAFANRREHPMVRGFISTIGFLAAPHMRGALRLAFGQQGEVSA